MRLISDINDAMQAKNKQQKEALESAKGTNRRTF